MDLAPIQTNVRLVISELAVLYPDSVDLMVFSHRAREASDARLLLEVTSDLIELLDEWYLQAVCEQRPIGAEALVLVGQHLEPIVAILGALDAHNTHLEE